jgi:hypothetical protein
MAETETQTQTTSVGSADDSSSSANSNTGSDSSQTSNSTVDRVDGGKSTASDESSGAVGDGERARPGRAERRISELTKTIKDLEGQLAEVNLQSGPVDSSKIDLPDYSKMTEVTPDQLKSDIIKAAEQIVDQKMQSAGKDLTNNLTQQQAMAKSSQAIEATITKYSVLNPDSEDYDSGLDDEITTAYADILKKDPTYSFSQFIKPFTRILESSDTTSKDTSKTESRSRAANRASAPVKRSNEFPEGGTADEMEKWFASQR